MPKDWIGFISSPNMKYASIDAPIGSPNMVIATILVLRCLKAQLKAV